MPAPRTYHPAAIALQRVLTQSMAIERELARLLGLNLTDYRALSVLTQLGREAAVTVGRLGAALGTTPATTSAIVDRLERAGYARRHRGDAGDRRHVTLETTPDSWARIMQLMLPLMDSSDDYVTALSDPDQRAVTEFLEATVRQLTRHLEVLGAQPPA